MAKMKEATGGTKLAELAKTTRLKGKVCITDEKGVTHEYADEAAAHAAWRDKLHLLEHRRGAFFVKAEERATSSTPAPKSRRSEK
jgi:hypothetical protein